jgi:hypothetical protein
MEMDNIRPVFSGLLGGVIAVWVGHYMTRYLPREWAGKSAIVLVRQNRIPIFISNIVFFSGIVFGIYLYVNGSFDKRDWRGLGIGFGVSCVGPMIVLPLSSIVRGHRIGEAFVAFSISQRMPPWLLLSLLTSGVVSLVASLGSIYA